MTPSPRPAATDALRARLAADPRHQEHVARFRASNERIAKVVQARREQLAKAPAAGR